MISFRLFLFLAAFLTFASGAAFSKVNAQIANNDSLFTQKSKLMADAPAFRDRFGWSVDVFGDTAIVGAYEDDINNVTDAGAAYIFVKTGSSWTQQAVLSASDGAGGDRFGYSVAIYGDTAIVGAWSDDVGGNNQGSAYIFVRNGATWTEQQKLTASDGASQDHFGFSVAIQGDTAFVGSDDDDVLSSEQGSVYVYVRKGATWTENQKLTASDGGADDTFGSSLAVSGDTLLIGAQEDDTPGEDQGSAYIFTRSGSTWSERQKLLAPDGAFGDFFGCSVAIDGSTAVIGALYDRIEPNVLQGSAHVYVRAGDSWIHQQKLIASDGFSNDSFGRTVAITGNTIIAGTINEGNPEIASHGSAYVYTRSGASWTERQKILANDRAEFDDFGSVAVWGNTLIVGAYLDDNVLFQDEGSAYIFQLRRGAFDFDGDSKSDLSIFRPSAGEWWILKSSDGGNAAFQFGTSSDRLTPGDFTGDGLTDVAIFRPSTGEWFVLRSEDSSYYSFPFGVSGDLPTPADFDADGKTDAAVFRPSSSTWFISLSTGGTLIQGFGQSGDVPVASDYDGDGQTDIAIYRPVNGQWWLQRSTAGLIVFQFGNSSDKTVQGDYTGDGKADVAIWRPATGEWLILRSEDSSYYSFPFGASTDIPAPGDYDGDGKSDAAVFRPSDTNWYVQRSTAGTLIQQFGIAGDVPVPNAFVR